MNEAAIKGGLGITSLISNAGFVVQIVLLILFALSVVCWAIILFKWLRLRQARKESNSFIDIFWNEKRLDLVAGSLRDHETSPVAIIFRAGYMELMKAAKGHRGEGAPFSASRLDIIERALRRTENMEFAKLEKHLSFLATTGSAAPFIGLFGTVWGIMNSFQQIGAMGSASLAVVAPGVSEALVATAIGLAAAIPAVIFYNIFTERIKNLSQETESIILEFLNIAEKGLRKESDERDK
ncbi:MAG: protein TolQ [bacterium]|nr:protein TolQ [bacterium]